MAGEVVLKRLREELASGGFQARLDVLDRLSRCVGDLVAPNLPARDQR